MALTILDLDITTLDALGPWVAVLDARGRVLHLNPPLCVAAGRSLEACRELGFWEIFELGPANPTFQRVFADLRAENFPNRHDAVLRMPDGHRQTSRWVNTVVTDDSGKIVRIVGVGFPEAPFGSESFTDTPHESVLRFEALASNATDPISELDSAGRMVYVSPNYETVLGVPPRELLGLSPLHMVHPDDQANARAFLAELAAGRSAQVGDLRVRHADGSWVWLDVSGTPYDAADGKRRSICVSRDITRRRLAERSSAGFGRILEESLNEIYSFDAETLRFTRVNRRGCDNLGYSMDELRRMTPFDIKPEFEEVAFRALLAPLHAGDVEQLEFETVHQRRDGTTYPVEVHLWRAELDDREQMVAIILDLTDRQQAERRARDAEHLASIGTLAAGLAHDIGTPMNVILGYADMLERTLRDERDQGRARIIGEQVRRISHLVQTLLHLARPGDADQTVAVDLSKAIDESLDFLGEKLVRHSIEVRREIQATPTVKGDPNQVQQVLVNLFVNAVDAMREGGTLTVRLRPAEGDHVELRVADTGCGIAPQDLARVFEPFFTTKEKGKGTGLGLLVAKRIVFDHGGHIDVESREGEGTEFRIALPLGGMGASGA